MFNTAAVSLKHEYISFITANSYGKLSGDYLDNKMKSSQGSASLLALRHAVKTRKKSVGIPAPSCVLCSCDAGCGMLVGSFYVKCFLFSFSLPYSIPCLLLCYSFSPYTSGIFPVYVQLLVMYHWLSVPNNGKSALFALRPVYACTSHVQQPLYCF